jgi:hypothetical protein
MEQKKRRRGSTREKIVDREMAQHDSFTQPGRKVGGKSNLLTFGWRLKLYCISVREIADNGKKDKRFIPRGE